MSQRWRVRPPLGASFFVVFSHRFVRQRIYNLPHVFTRVASPTYPVSMPYHPNTPYFPSTPNVSALRLQESPTAVFSITKPRAAKHIQSVLIDQLRRQKRIPSVDNPSRTSRRSDTPRTGRATKRRATLLTPTKAVHATKSYGNGWFGVFGRRDIEFDDQGVPGTRLGPDAETEVAQFCSY